MVKFTFGLRVTILPIKKKRHRFTLQGWRGFLKDI